MNQLYELEGCTIKVDIEPKLIRVYGNAELWRFLDGAPSLRFDVLIDTIKKDYENHLGKPLMITNDSLIVEIVAHVYCDYIGLIFNRLVKISLIQRLVTKLLKRAEIVDCGEKGVDSNRWLWDYLARYKLQIVKLLPKKLNSTKLKQH
ncbi:hypothetical protein DHW03_04695 [Pedobacter yonginense]|uniref:Uncharacterized protein n=1 Tax=Pedobacter yonginense TaxID=651869 RepID=A0A317ESR5_9SPHI|nr:hypothetical protein [Pedobacter yonginense]PWS29127.1 hypothetical protein DHW03_04695 [Pedobacter yonginense]